MAVTGAGDSNDTRGAGRHPALEDRTGPANSLENVYKSMENNRLYVVFEPDIGHNLAGLAERWGEDYNRNRLGGIRSMVFCSAGYSNRVSNLEPRLLALCLLHLTLYRQDNMTHLVFLRPTVAGAGSKAAALLQELESEVAAAVEQGLKPGEDQARPD